MADSPAHLLGHHLRHYTPEDRTRVLELINADQIPGQPPAGDKQLDEALAGHSLIDSAWWAELDAPQTDVLLDPNHEVTGVISYAHRHRDNAGLILWMHAREHEPTIRALLHHAIGQLHGADVIEAFSIATALGLGLEALPIRHRPKTDAALRALGFTAHDLWCYMRRELRATELHHPDTQVVRHPNKDGRGVNLAIRDGGLQLGSATVDVPSPGIGVLWWIGVHESCRQSGVGTALLQQALRVLQSDGASEVILYVDDDEPGGDRDRSAAKRLYARNGFHEIDRLNSYTLTAARGPRRAGR